MSSPTPLNDCETLDPADWDAARQSAHRMIDDMVDYLSSVRERPAWRTVPAEVRQSIAEDLPRAGKPLDEVYDQFQRDILPYPTGNLHPGFFGWVMGNGSLTGALADALASAMNAHVAGYDQSAAFVERQVISWLSELVGYAKDASGLLVTGGTMANLNGLAVARNEKAGFDVRAHGVAGAGQAKLRVYGSKETHSWIYKACELMGMGHDAFRAIPVNADYQIDIEECRKQIEQDIASGDKPFCIIGTAGTVNTAAVDDFHALRALADEFDLWFHIDGAFGTLAAWSPDTASLVAGQELSDSIAFDLHKWGYMPYDVGCVLTRHSSAQERAFGSEASYLSPTKRGLAVGTTYFADKGVQLSRSFRALKVWMCMKEQGVDKIGRMIARNVAQAQTLKALVDARPGLERLAPVSMNIVCFRYKDDALSEAQLDDLNQEILLSIQESGRSVPSHILVDGKFAIRVCITNHRTHESDLVSLVEDVLQHAKSLLEVA